MSKAPTKKEREHLSRVAGIGCLICQKHPELHHIRSNTGLAVRSSHYHVIPLCFDHHSAQSRLGFGHAVHKGVKTFEKRYGSQKELLEQVYNILHAAYPIHYPTNEVING